MGGFMMNMLFGSRIRAKALGWLMTHPDDWYFVRRLTVILEEDSTNLSRELARLARMGILVTRREGKHRYYRVNRDSPLFDELRGLAVKTVGLADVIRTALKPLAEGIRSAFIYGSFAAGEETGRSDVDVMVIGDISFKQVSRALGSAEKKLAREINPTVYPLAEFRAKIVDGHHFLNTVIKEKKIFLMGDDDELGRLAEKAHRKPKRNR